MHRLASEKVVVDIGSGTRFGKWLKKYEPLFAKSEYRTFDADSITGADIVGDIHAIPLEDGSVDAIICSSVLEHVRDPLRAADELRRIVRKGGVVFCLVPSTYPYHSHGARYPDYWRFFEETVRELFAGYASVEIRKRGGYFLALSFYVPMQARMRWLLTPVAEFLDGAFRTDRKNTTAGYYVLATK